MNKTKLLANENFPFKSVVYLRSRGFDVNAVGIDNPGITDAEVMKMAIDEQRTILTFDRDYGELIFKHHFQPPEGVIYLRINQYSPEEPGREVERLINDPDLSLSQALTVVDETGVRQRRY